MVTRSQIDNARPEAVVELVRRWATAATTLESAADDYKGFLDKPGGQYWEGATAEQAQARGADDRKAVIGMADALTKLSTDTVNMMTESVMPALKNARQLIENCEKHPGFKINDDLSVSYTAPEGTSDKDEKAAKDAVAGFAQQIKDAADTWWQAEQHVADQITAGQNGLAANFNPLAGAMDPSEELRALQTAMNQAVIDQLAKVKAAKDALDKAAALAYTHPNDPEGQAAFANRDTLAAEYGRALDDLGNIPDYSKVDPKGMSASADGHFLLGYTADGHPVQVTGQLRNGNGEIFDQAKQTYFTFQDGKLVGSRRLDSGSVRPDDELLLNAVTAAVGAPEMAAGLKLGGEAAWQGFKSLLGREGFDGASFGAGHIAAADVLPKAFAAAEARAHTAADNLALEHATDLPKAPIAAAGDHYAPIPIGEHPPPPTSIAEHTAPMDTRAHPPPTAGDHPVTSTPDGLDHHLPIGPMPPESVGDIHKWLPEINHDSNGFDPLRTVNCGSCALAVDQRLSGMVPDATAGLGTLSTPQMEAATGLQQVPGTPAQIEQYLSNQGAGAHTVIGVDRAGAPGHWFNAYYDGKNVYAIDGQTGQILGWPPNMDMAGHPVTNWDYGVQK